MREKRVQESMLWKVTLTMRSVGGTHSTRRNCTLTRPPPGDGFAIYRRHYCQKQSQKANEGMLSMAGQHLWLIASRAPWPRSAPADRCVPARTLGTCP